MSNSNLPPISEEQLSQLMDGEWDEINSSQCVAGICKDEQLRSKWSRYHLIRDCIKSEPVQVNNQLLANISAAIADEPAYSNISSFSAASDQVSEKSATVTATATATVTATATATSPAAVPASNNTFWGTGLRGFAVAASVAAVTVVGMNVWQGQNAVSTNSASTSVAINSAVSNEGVGAFSQQVNGAPLPQVDFVANTGSYWVSPQTAERVTDEERLNMFLSQHLENSPTASREGLLSYSRLVAYDEQAAEQ
jgi:sigma-E factor negative regulatory protein RseA